MRTVVFYRMESGHCPVEDFLDSLSGKQAQKVLWVLRLIEEIDSVPSRYFRKLVHTGDMWEVRVQIGPNIFRLLGFFDGPACVILNHAFQKKTRETPRHEIERAEKRKRALPVLAYLP